jgi:integrase
VIGGLAVIAGLRPGEIFGLVCGRLEAEYADIHQRVYRGVIDSPKTINSKRWAALSSGLTNWIRQWCEMLPDSSSNAWVFPSEKGSTPLSRDNCWRRNFLPKLKAVGLEWANFQVMRRTHSCLQDDLGVDPQVRADQMGHTVDVNQNVYTRASMARRKEAVTALENALGVM